MSQKEILTMVQDGTITAEEGIKLMAALEEEAPVTRSIPKSNNHAGKMLRIIVDSKEEGKKNSKVRVNIPVSFIKLAVQTGKGLDIEGIHLDDSIDLDLIMNAIEEGVVGEIINVETDDTYVYIVIE